MKNIILIILFLLIIVSCKRECSVKNILDGKLREYISYNSTTDSSNQIGRLRFNYDSINGHLKKITFAIKQNGTYIDTFGSVLFKQLDNNRTLIIYNDIAHLIPEKYIIYHIDKKINKISIINSSMNEEEVTNLNISNSSFDTINDTGLYPFSSVNLYDFNFIDGNCRYFTTKFTMETNGGSLIDRTIIDTFKYTTLPNVNFLPRLIIGVDGLGTSPFTYYGKIMMYATFEGFYSISPNKNLISEFFSSGNFKKFDYNYIENKLTKISVVSNNNFGDNITDLKYY